MSQYLDSPFVILSFLASAFCIYHVLKYRKPWWWILLILFFPVFGCIWYFLREVRGISGSTHMQRRMVNQNPERPPASKKMIADLESHLEISDTVATRLKLAECHLELGNYQPAIEYFESCLRGYHTDDPVILFGLSRALFFAGHYDRCLDTMDILDKTGRSDYQNERLLLRARALAGAGMNEKADGYFEQASNRLPGEEARCLYAQFLEDSGNREKAEKLFEEILKNASLGDGDYRSRNREWISIAKERVNR